MLSDPQMELLQAVRDDTRPRLDIMELEAVAAAIDEIAALRSTVESLYERIAKMESALLIARTTIMEWHGVTGWAEYQQSPEMKTIANALQIREGT